MFDVKTGVQTLFCKLTLARRLLNRKWIFILLPGILGITAGLAGIAWFWFTRSASVVTDFTPTENARLTITLPDTVTAGKQVPVLITAPTLPDETPIILTAIGTYGLHPQSSRLRHGLATFYLPASDTRAAGLMTLVASTNQARAEAQLLIRPGPPADPIITVVGPRSILADGQDQTMLVALPTDAFGNPVASQTPVDISVRRPGAEFESHNLILQTETRHLLAWARLPSGTVAGQTRLAVSVGAAHSIEETVLEVPGQPVSFTLSAEPTLLPADGRQLAELTTSPIADAHGNLLPEGTTATFLITDAGGGRRTIPAAIVFNGRAQTVLQAPTRPGKVTVQAMVAGVLSRPLQLTFTTGVALADDEIPLSASFNVEGLILRLGPLAGSLGQFIPDGTPVEVVVLGPDDYQWQEAIPADRGYITAEVRQSSLLSGQYSVLVRLGQGQGRATFMVP
jgi:hypothetical protein